MGGTTIVVYGKLESDILQKLREQIIIGARIGLWPDSVAVIINGDDMKAAAKLFSVRLDDTEKKVDFEQVDKGSTFHVGVAAKYYKAPAAGQLLGTLHLHS